MANFNWNDSKILKIFKSLDPPDSPPPLAESLKINSAL